MFHRVLPRELITHPNAYTDFGTLISQEFFEEVLETLALSGFAFATISELVERKSKNKRVALTFDDGYADNIEFAVPSLRKYNATATFYPVVNPCKLGSVLPLDVYYQCVDELNLNEQQREEYIFGPTKKNFYWAKPEIQKKALTELFTTIPLKLRVKYLSSAEIKSMSETGFEIGSHGMTHSLFTAEYMSEHMAMKELKDSKDWLESITGSMVKTFCFPAGRYNSRSIELARDAGYTSTCLVVRNDHENDTIPSFERFYVKPNSLEELKTIINEL